MSRFYHIIFLVKVSYTERGQNNLNKMSRFNNTEETNKTPIEIALGIDDNGMTAASNLYLFLELESKNFSRWCKKNIIENKFAIENEDYFPFVIQEERYNPHPKTDYRITSKFAKSYL